LRNKTVKSGGTYLVAGQAVLYACASQLLQELFGVQLSAASITRFVSTCHWPLTEVKTQLEAALVNVFVLDQDEMGLWARKIGWWVHVSSTDRLTYYAAHQSRGRVAMFCYICRYLSILRKQGIDLLSALDHTLAGHSVFPAFAWAIRIVTPEYLSSPKAICADLPQAKTL
jgi:hypothetical protein